MKSATLYFRRDNITFPLLIILFIDSVKNFFQEAFGRYLDLHELYHQYINSKFGEPIEYSAYLDVFSETDKIPRKIKMTK